MNRRGLLVAIAAAATLNVSSALAQEPIVFGVITPLSPPGETGLGQLVKRGSEIAVDYLNEKGGVLGRKVVLSIQDSAGKNEQGVAAYRRLVSNEKAVAVFGFIHSGVNIAVNEVAKEMGVPTMGTQTGAGDVTAKHYDIAFRTHAVDPPRAATWLGWAKKNGFKRMSIVAETTDYGIGLAKATEAQNKSMNIGLEIQTIMFDRTTTDLLPQLLQVKAFKPDCIINVGVGQPLDLMITQAIDRRPAAEGADGDLLRCAGAAAALAAPQGAGRRHPFHRVLHAASRSSATSASGSPRSTRRSSTSRRSMPRSTASATRS